MARATAVATAGRSLTESQCHELEEQVLGSAVEQDARAVKAAAARAVLAIDADGAEFRRQRAIADRRVVGLPAEDGMVDLYAQLPGLAWVIVSSAINAAARAVKASGDGRTLDQLRADALVAPFAKALRTGILDGLDPITLGKHRGVVPGVNVHVSLATLAGVNESSGWLDGLGPISAAQTRELAADGVWRRILTDPATGAVVDVGTTVYQPPRSMARLVESRDRRCRFPGCWVPAERCDLDHTVPFPAGSTAVDNLGSLCRHHHRLKHELPGTTLTQTADGQFIWTLPTGHYYVDHPSDGDPPGG